MPRLEKFNPALIPEQPHLEFETALWKNGLKYIAGIDEAGRGALAGPVFAAAAILPADPQIETAFRGVRDSKQMSASERDVWGVSLKEKLLFYGVGRASCGEIDDIGIVAAVRLAVLRALARLAVTPDHLLVDFMRIPESSIPQTPLVKGDARSLSIASASVLAKTARDAYMVELDSRCPGYGFAANKGYGTRAHRFAIERLGRSPHHRLSFNMHTTQSEPTS